MMIYHEEAANEVQSIAVPYEDRRRWSLTKEECIELAQMALKIEDYFAKPMDIEWAKDGVTGTCLLFKQGRRQFIPRQKPTKWSSTKSMKYLLIH